jgi:hypothetical protein
VAEGRVTARRVLLEIFLREQLSAIRAEQRADPPPRQYSKAWKARNEDRRARWEAIEPLLEQTFSPTGDTPPDPPGFKEWLLERHGDGGDAA